MNLKTATLLISFFGMICGLGCVDEKDKVWEGRIFPGGGPGMKIDIGKFLTLELCRDAANLKLKAMRIAKTSDYECRKNCKTDAFGNEECEETVRSS